MLVCLDGSATAASILPVVRQWAANSNLEVHLLHIAYPLGDPRAATSRSLRRPARSPTSFALPPRCCRTPVSLPDGRWRRTPGDAAGIVGQATSRMADLIALATHGRTGLARVIAGSVASETVRRATVPVLTLRPEGLR
jgi:hypothetical protein